LAEQVTGTAGIRKVDPVSAADARLSLLALALMPLAMIAVGI
jgi:hypothetical protein